VSLFSAASGKPAEGDEAHPPSETRVTVLRVATAALTLLAVIGLVVALSQLSSAYSQVQGETWAWLGPAVAAALVVYLARALGLLQAVAVTLPLVRTTVLFGSESFTTMATPGGVGSFALTVRYLNRHGLDLPAATSSASLASLVATVIQLLALLIALPFTLAVFSAADVDAGSLPSVGLVALGVLAVATLVAVLWHVPRLRTRALPPLRRAVGNVAVVLRQPGTALRLAGAEALVPVAQVLCLWATLSVFHLSTSVAVLVLVTQLANLAQRAVPVPGALGAPEAVLVAGLAAAGLPKGPVLAAAVTYRMLTYWLPPVPGFFGIRALHHRGDL
jgi:undecaprenyl-diphosphatase